MSEGLKSDKFLGNIIIFLKEKNEAVTELHQRLSAELTVRESLCRLTRTTNPSLT